MAVKSGKKQEKEEKRKHDSGKLSDGDKIDLMRIIRQTNVFVVNSSLFSFYYFARLITSPITYSVTGKQVI